MAEGRNWRRRDNQENSWEKDDLDQGGETDVRRRNSSVPRHSGQIQRGRGRDRFNQAPGMHVRSSSASMKEVGARPIIDNHDVRRGHGRGRGGVFQDYHRGPRSREGPRPLHPALLRQISSLNPSDITLKLIDKHNGLDTFLELEYSTLSGIQEFVKVAAKACDSPLNQNLVDILTRIADATPFLTCLTNYIRSMPRQKSVRAFEEFPGAIRSILRLLRELLTRLPSRHENVSEPFEALASSMGALKRMKLLDDPNLHNELSELEEMRDALFNKERYNTNEEYDQRKRRVREVPLDPPDDFREIPEFPTRDELLSTQKPFIRPNIIHGQYEDLDHYLDVQYRLYREDFIAPLREGLQEYMMEREFKGKQRLQDIQVYTDVYIVGPVCESRGLNHMIQFDVSRLKRVQWEFSKRLIFGALLCLSPDGFNHLLFATVANRDPKFLRDGYIEVRFQGGVDEVSKVNPDTSFCMVETMAYFEACRHVLKGIQEVKEIPFDSYLLHCNVGVKPPKYLRADALYDFSPMFESTEDTSSYIPLELIQHMRRREQVKGHDKVPVSMLARWPSGAELHLDDSQLQAVKTALTKEFAVIQGPPGTGKTYIGLKIVKTLLKNRQAWCDGQSKTPMLIVCYTNHALDQFLEGIHCFQRSGIVRAGSRSNSEALKGCMLSELRQQRRSERSVRREVFTSRCDTRERLREIAQQIEVINKFISNATYNILSGVTLRSFMDGHQYLQFVQNIRVYQVQHLGSDVNLLMMKLWLEELVSGVEEIEEHYEATNNFEELQVEHEADAIQNQRFGDEEYQRFGQGLDLKRSKGRDMKKDTRLSQQDGWTKIINQRKLAKRIKKGLQQEGAMDEQEARRVYDIWQLRKPDRWRLYRFWMQRYKAECQTKLVALQIRYETLSQQLEEIVFQEDLDILREASVIGMTTTGAAKYRSVLQQVKPRIIVVEEAAEVLEAHIITTLTQSCQHLILIGDHKQLRPNPTVYKLAREFNLEISLFERMVRNGMRCDCLDLQHRMRPEISLLMKHIYANLKDHESVLNMENVKGVMGNLYFIDHQEHEIHNEEILSHSNEHEAKFTISLCRYLLQQGYNASQITILTTYKGQLFKMKDLMKKNAKFFKDVRACVVDNFQGEENDIILLSLVRSNPEHKIGFLNVSNRVCVALSRARMGMFVIGNFSILASQSDLWKNLVSDLSERKQIGQAIPLACQNHPQTKINAASDKDFSKAPEGGCMLPCGARMPCGHKCDLPCHPYDNEHTEIRCKKPCGRALCERDHICQKPCWEDCGDCRTPVEKCMPICGHKQQVPCSVSEHDFLCRAPCQETLPCGHRCNKTCGEDCVAKCTISVEKALPCGHKQTSMCYLDKDKIECTTPCGMQLKCEHTCQGTCGKCKRGRLHISCLSACGRTLACGHQCNFPCTAQCPPCSEFCKNECSHSKCSKRCGDPCALCKEPCVWECRHHKCTRPCGMPCIRKRCNVPCRKKLKCGHLCIGLCGEPCPNKCRICNKDEVMEIFFGDEDEAHARFVELDCGHVLEVKGLDHWMEMSDESSGNHSIQVKVCPRCKAPVRHTLRYSNIMKMMQNDLEEVKRRMRGNVDEIRTKVKTLEAKYNRCPILKLARTQNVGDRHRDQVDAIENRLHLLRLTRRERGLGLFAGRGIRNELERIGAHKSRLDQDFCKLLQYMKQKMSDLFDAGDRLTAGEVALLENRLSLVPTIFKLVDGCLGKTREEVYLCIFEQVAGFVQWLFEIHGGICDQHVADIEIEIERLSAFTALAKVDFDIKKNAVTLDQREKEALHSLKKVLVGGKCIGEEGINMTRSILEEIRKQHPILSPITEKEKADIVKALGLPKGHWYKCPKGHIYAIGDCGGPNQGANCPDCGAQIGGVSHQLAQGNEVATEMDGAQYAAFSNEANLEIGPNVLFED